MKKEYGILVYLWCLFIHTCSHINHYSYCFIEEMLLKEADNFWYGLVTGIKLK